MMEGWGRCHKIKSLVKALNPEIHKEKKNMKSRGHNSQELEADMQGNLSGHWSFVMMYPEYARGRNN